MVMEPYHDQKLEVEEEHTSEDELMMHGIDKEFPHEFDNIPLSLLDSQSTSNQRVPMSMKDIDGPSTGPSSVITPNHRLEDQVCLEKYEGDYMFTASTCISHESRKRLAFSKPLNTLFIRSQSNFAVEFHVHGDRLPPSLYVRVMVCYSDPAIMAQHGPISPCSCNGHVTVRKPEYGEKFLISTSKTATYSDRGGHKTVSIRLTDLPVVDGKYIGIFSYASYTSCLVKNAKVATVFSLMNDSYTEIGRDLFYCNVCACPPRDIIKSEKRLNNSTENTPIRQNTPSLTQSFTDSVVPTTSMPDNGYFTFQWQTRDRELYDCLCNLKRICSRRHVTDDIHDQ